MSATLTALSYPLGGGRRLFLAEPRLDGAALRGTVQILDGKDAPLFSTSVTLTDQSSLVQFATNLGAQLTERHPDLVAQSGAMIAALVNWSVDPAAALAGDVSPPLLPQRGDYDTGEVAGVCFEVRQVSAPVQGYLHATIERLERGIPRGRAEIVFGNTDAERRAAERVGLDLRQIPLLREHVVASFYGPDGELPPLSTVDTPGDPCADKDRLIAELREQLGERDRRLRAIHELMTCAGMTPIERVIAYGVANEAAAAQSRKEEDCPVAAVVANQTSIATNVNVSRQAVGSTLKRWDEQGYLDKESRPTGQRTKDGAPIFETILRMPAKTSADLITIASTWVRPEGAKRVGGNGNRCPDCGGTKTKKTVETVLVRTTTITCDDCGHIHLTQSKQIGNAETLVTFGDMETDIPTTIDITRFRKPHAPEVSTVDTPPCSAVDSDIPIPADNDATPPPSTVDTPPAMAIIAPAFCAECGGEGRRPLGEVWTCAPCRRAQRGELAPYLQVGD